ncbi:MAG: TonB-dependent receptor [Ignavibacterium sp.]|nr:TonB-dependent receptor [Ignavibacterium sp.]
MSKNLIIILFVIFSQIIFSQNRSGNQQGMMVNGKISGTVIDAQTKQTIEYCNIILFNLRDSSMANGTISGKGGKFVIDNVRPGFYFLRASYIGYYNRTIDSILVTPRNPEVDLGIIALDEKTIELTNVVITGEKEVIINNLDKKVINVEKDLTNVGGTAVDVVQNIPSVSVDADGNVSYRGNQNIRILIDGKPSELLGLGSGDILSNIPASQIESIELVTNPSARYDPEGTGGILNIVLKKRINGGLNGNISLTAGTGDKFNGSLNFNYKLPDVNFFASIDSRIHNADNIGNSFRTNNINNSLSYLDQINNGTFNHFGHNFTAGFDITPDNYNTYTFSVRYRKFGFDNESLVKTKNLNSLNEVTRYFERNSDAERRMNAWQYTLSYKRTFDTKGAELTGDIILGDFKMNRDENFLQQNFNNDLTPTGETLTQKGLSNNKNLQWTIQSNYINPIEGFGRIETGFKITLKNFNSKNDYLNFDNNSNIWLNDITRKTDFDYKENVYAIYGIYSNNIGGFQYQLGLRAEQADVTGTENLTNSSFTNDYFSFYPTVHLVQSLPDQQELQLSYSRRVERPNNRRLNPYIDRSDSLNISKGNPELKPEYINALEFGYSKLFGKTAITSSIFYRNTNDAITNFTVVNDDGITETTWRNLAKNLSYGLELTLSSPLVDWFRTNTSFTYFKNEFEGLGISNSDYSWMAKMNNTFMLSKDFNFQINLNYNAPTIMGQSKMKEQFATDFAMKKDFLDGQLSLTLRISDVFNTRKWDSETVGQNFITTSYRKMESRVAYLGISYRLSPGNNNRERERRPRDEEGMDEF